METFQCDPKKPDPLLKLASHYRSTGDNQLSYLFAKQGSLIAQNEGSILASKFQEELSIVSYYTPFYQEGFEAANNLLLGRDVPWAVKDLCTRNILFYIHNLPKSRFKEIKPDLPLIEEGNGESYRAMNPSIYKKEDGYKVICRAVNYDQLNGWKYTSLASDEVIRTRNFLLEYSKDFEKISQVEIEDDFSHKKHSLVRGREDCRLFSFQGEDWFTYTDFLYTSDVIDSKIALSKLRKDTTLGKGSVEKTLPLLGPDPKRFEKNWLPFEKNGNIYIVYLSDPMTIYRIELKTGECEPFVEYTPESDFSRFRGSASPIPFQGGYLMIIHEVAFFCQEQKRIYTHRFVYLDSDFRIKKVSKPFTFTHQGIEFCSGMTLDDLREEIVMTVGIEDREAFFVFTPVDEVIRMLEPHE